MKNRALMLYVVMLSGMMLVLWGCPKKAEVASTPESQAVQPAPAEVGKQEAQPEPAPAEVEKQEAQPEPVERAAKAEDNLQPIYFDFDKSFIRDDARPVMKANAEWLKANPNVKIRIEGNCDERGTIEYNQALGQRRAQAAKKYLTDLGVSASRISIISYGEEKPICTESNETCWQKNRRADFVEVE